MNQFKNLNRNNHTKDNRLFQLLTIINQLIILTKNLQKRGELDLLLRKKERQANNLFKIAHKEK